MRLPSVVLLFGVSVGAAAGGAIAARAPGVEHTLTRAGVLGADFGSISGLAYDGFNLWITLDGRPIIHAVEPDSGRILRSIPFATGDTGGSAWDGRVLWQLAYLERMIYRVDPQTGRFESAFASPGTGQCSGMTFDGRYLWVANFDAERIFQIDQEDGGRIVRSIEGHFETTGLAWDGRFLWSGVLVGTKTHSEVTPHTGFVQQQDPASEETLTVVPVPGVGPGTSDWLPGRARASRFWWYDGVHRRVLVLTNAAAAGSWAGLFGARWPTFRARATEQSHDSAYARGEQARGLE